MKAKTVLFNVAEKLKSDGSITIDLPPNKVRRAEGDDRCHLVSDDILELWTVPDAAKAPLPTFAAVVWKRLPPTSLTDTDIHALTVSMMEMKNRLEELTTQLPAMIKSQLSAWQPFIQPTHVLLELPDSSSNKLYTDQPSGSSKPTIIIYYF